MAHSINALHELGGYHSNAEAVANRWYLKLMKTREIVEKISTAIARGRLPPGAKLIERDLADAFGVSRTIVRQALSQLQQEGLVSISPKRATTVVKPTIEQAHLLFDAIGLIESAVMQRLAESQSKDFVAPLRKHVEQEAKAAAAGQRAKANRLGRDFHEVLVGFVGNPLIAKAHSQLIRQQALITSLFRTEFDYADLQREHAEVVECLARGDSQAANRVMRGHYRLVILGYNFSESEAMTIDAAKLLAGSVEI